MSTKVDMFSGSKANVNAQRWFRQFEGAKLKQDSNDKTCAWLFSRHLEPRSRADKWYTTDLTQAQRDTWTQTVSAFNLKWPAVTKTEPSVEDWQLKLDEHVLPASLLGLRLDTGEEDETEYSHRIWVNELEVIIDQIGDNKGLLIPVARCNLPKAIVRCLPGKLSTWTLFNAAVRDISLHTLALHTEDEQDREATNTALAAMANLHVNPKPTPYRQPAPPPASTPPTPRTMARTHWSTTPSPQAPAAPATPARTIPRSPLAAPPATPQRQPATTLTSAGLVPRTPWSAQMGSATRVDAYPATPTPKRSTGNTGALEEFTHQAIAANLPYPDTAQGMAEYKRDKATWEVGNGGPGREVSWNSKHIPLWPGSSPLGSSECYNCGRAGHRRDECPEPNQIIPGDEAQWRVRINGTLVAARKAKRFASASPGSDALPTFFMIGGEEIAVDASVYDTSNMDFLDDEEEQGKA